MKPDSDSILFQIPDPDPKPWFIRILKVGNIHRIQVPLELYNQIPIRFKRTSLMGEAISLAQIQIIVEFLAGSRFLHGPDS